MYTIKFIIYRCKMEGQNLNFTGVQSYRKFHYDIMKLARTYSYQGKFLEKFPAAGQLEI